MNEMKPIMYHKLMVYAFLFHAVSILHCNLFITLVLRRMETSSLNESKIVV